jgi:hypothetical protein
MRFLRNRLPEGLWAEPLETRVAPFLPGPCFGMGKKASQKKKAAEAAFGTFIFSGRCLMVFPLPVDGFVSPLPVFPFLPQPSEYRIWMQRPGHADGVRRWACRGVKQVPARPPWMPGPGCLAWMSPFACRLLTQLLATWPWMWRLVYEAA